MGDIPDRSAMTSAEIAAEANDFNPGYEFRVELDDNGKERLTYTHEFYRGSANGRIVDQARSR